MQSDLGVAIAKARDEWRDDLTLILDAHTSKITTRVVIAIATAVGLIKFELPQELTVATLAVAVLGKGVWTVVAARLSSD